DKSEISKFRNSVNGGDILGIVAFPGTYPRRHQQIKETKNEKRVTKLSPLPVLTQTRKRARPDASPNSMYLTKQLLYTNTRDPDPKTKPKTLFSCSVRDHQFTREKKSVVSDIGQACDRSVNASLSENDQNPNQYDFYDLSRLDRF
ncbi:hypothetical protein Tco_1179134, partial [Tanacetum coccineum]